MASAGYVFDAPTGLDYYFSLMAEAREPSSIIDAVHEYLASWSKARIANLQKIDAGWAPFDAGQQPLQIDSALGVRCVGDAIHKQCMALRDAGVALTPELVELDEFFFAAREMVEHLGCAAPQGRTPPIKSEASGAAATLSFLG